MDHIKTKPRPGEIKQLKEEAWLGDAALELVMRQWVLENRGQLDMATKQGLTCNAFLSCLGHPTKVEAQIGRIYRDRGLEAARTWIMEFVLPVYLRKQQRSRQPTKAPRPA